MKIRTIHWIFVGIGLLIVIFSYFVGQKLFFFILGLGLLIIVSPFVISMMIDKKIEKEKEEMFIEFARSLVESVKTGTPISKSIINLKNKNYGSLNPHIKKLANQISIGIPLNTALQIFAKDINNKTITRSLILIGQAEKAGGDIGEILEAVANAVVLSDKLKKERLSVISSLVSQGYIIFIIFLIIILILQHKIIPLMESIQSGFNFSQDSTIKEISGMSVSSAFNKEEIGLSFLYLLILQGFFSGLAIGKLAEGEMKAGLKHSFILILISFFIYNGVNLVLSSNVS